MVSAFKFWPFSPSERRKLAMEVRGMLCRCCGGFPPWCASADVCVECEVRLTGGVLALAVERANARQAARVEAIARRIG